MTKRKLCAGWKSGKRWANLDVGDFEVRVNVGAVGSTGWYINACGGDELRSGDTADLRTAQLDAEAALRAIALQTLASMPGETTALLVDALRSRSYDLKKWAWRDGDDLRVKGEAMDALAELLGGA